MFKRFINTGVNLTRIGIETVTKAVSKPIENPRPTPPKTTTEKQPHKTAISGLKANLLRQASFKHDKILLETTNWKSQNKKLYAPDLKFTATGSNKSIKLHSLNKPAVLFISHRENAKQAARMNWSLIQPYVDKYLPFFTANIILLNEFPAFSYPMVQFELRRAYNDIIKDYVKDADLAAQIVHLLPDWKAESINAFHLAQRRPVMATVILTPYSEIHCVIESTDPMPIIQQELAELTQ